ncbi:MAG: prepilin-type N-terminal cleavage/methylation domain-containing protein [Saprospiraceae bacterium]|nr:prepilin-type N-terminal cleavage/methylation domain-containing protein [Saprospiraceae bacterium]
MNKRNGFTLMGVIIAVIFTLMMIVAFCTGCTPEPAANSMEVGAVKPRHNEWEVIVVWEQIPPFARSGENHLPLDYTVQQKEMPTIENLNVPMPPQGKWEVAWLHRVKLVRAGTYPEETLPEEPKK